jgi:hypothetical protein
MQVSSPQELSLLMKPRCKISLELYGARLFTIRKYQDS